MITNPLINQLNTKLQEGAINQSSYALQLKRIYDRSHSGLSVDDVKYLEQRLTDLNVPFAKEEASDGLIKQTISGFIEGFTTFGFADEPDTGTEKIFNNVAHLVGLAPGVVMGGIGMLSGASKVVSANLKAQAKKTGDKQLKKLADNLNEVSKSASKKQSKVQEYLSKIAEKTTRVDSEGKVLFSLGKQTGFNPLTQKPIYDLKSIPGRLADKTQELGLSFLGKNQEDLMQFFTKGVLRNRFSREKVGNIINESVHVGLLMAYSQHPFATRNTEGFHQTMMAGMHGGLAGGIFGSIGQYANISTLLNSGSKSVRAIGEGMVRSTARNLSYSTTLEREAVVNTMLKSTSGAGYGLGTSIMNDLPPEEVIYETLMGIFFSVNGKPGFENRANKDILDRSRAIPRSKQTEKSMKGWLYRQEWYQNETESYKAYMRRHVDAIYKEQEKIIGTFPLAKLEFQKVLSKALQDGVVNEKQVRDIMDNTKVEEGMFAVMEKVNEAYNRKLDVDYTPPPETDAYSKTKFINLVKLTDQLALRAEITATNEVDFPVDRLSFFTKRIYKTLKRKKARDYSIDNIQKGVDTIWKDSLKRNPGNEKKQVDDFVKSFQDLVASDSNIAKRVIPKDAELKKIRQLAHTLREFSAKKNVSILRLIDKDGKVSKSLPILDDLPAENPSGAPINIQTSGNRLQKNLNEVFKKGFKNIPDFEMSSIDYLEVMQTKNIVNQKGEKKPVVKRVFISPLSKDPFTGEVKINAEKFQLIETDLNTDSKFIFGGISDTGKLDIRSFPWARTKFTYDKGTRKRTENPNFLSKQDRLQIAELLSEKDTKGKLIDPTKIKLQADNIVGTYIYRLISLNMIKNPNQITKEYLLDRNTLINYVNAEINNGTVGVNKLQKYLNQVDKTEIPFIEDVAGEKYRGIIVKDPKSSIKGEADSGVDGVVVISNKRFDFQAKNMGIDKLASQAKGTLFSGADGIHGDITGKFAYKRADNIDQAYLEKNNLDFYIYSTSAKTNGGVSVSNNAVGKLPSGRKTKNYDYSLNTFEVGAKDFHMNLNIYESLPTDVHRRLNRGADGERTSLNPEDHTVNLMQEVFLNSNTIQFNPKDGGVGEAYHKGWRNLIRKNAGGDKKENDYIEKQLKNNEPLRDDVSLDQIDVRILDRILSSSSIKTKTAESIIEKLLFRNDDSSLVRDYEQDVNNNFMSTMIKDVFADNNFSHVALAQKGNSEWVQKTFRQYVMGRLTKPKIKYTYKSILGPYDYKITGKKQKYSSAKKGLAKDEFMLTEGAENLFYVKVQGKEYSLGEWWAGFKDLTDNVNPYTSNYASWTNAKKKAWKDAQYALINRSPVMTSGNVRALKFVGFVRGQGVKTKRGTSLITAENNDRYMGGADKDIDSAHVSFGMPKNIVEGYKQEHVRSEMQVGQKDSGKPLDLKDQKINEREAGAKYDADNKSDTKKVLEHLDLNTRLEAAGNMAFGKDTIGIIHNMHAHAKTIIDLLAQKNPKYQTKEGRKSITEFFQNFLIRNASVSNAYIDAADARYLWPAKQTETKIYKDLDAFFGESSKDILSTIREYHTASMKGILPENKSYADVSKEMLDLYGDATSYKKITAEFLKDMKLEIDPFAGYDKENIFNLNQKAIKAIMDDPIGQFFGIRDTVDMFNANRLLTAAEKENIYNHPHFLYNKLNVVGVLKSILKTNEFVSNHTANNLGLNAKDLKLFAREIAHIAYAQKQGFIHKTKIAKNYNIDSERMSYNEQVLLSKEYLKQEVSLFFKNKSGNLDKSLLNKLSKDIENLYDYWHIAFPYLDLNYSGMDVAKSYSGKKKDLKVSVHNRYVAYVRQGEKVRQALDKRDKNGNFKNGKDKQNYEKQKEILGSMEWAAEGLVNRGANNMQRSSSISKEVRVEMNEFYQKYLELTNAKDSTIQEMELNNLVEPYMRVGLEKDTAPGEVVSSHIEQTGRFIKESLIDWETIENITVNLPKSIKNLEKEVKKLNITNEDVIFEANRFGENVNKILSRGHNELALQITEMYTGVMQRLDIVAKQSLEDADYDRIKILNNIIENRYIGTHKEWSQRIASHRKLLKEWKDKGLDPDNNVLPPDMVTDMMFPTELNKFWSKYEKVFKVERVQIVDKDSGKFKEYGARVPSSTIEFLGETVGRMNDAGNALKKAYDNYWNGLLDTIRPTDEALFVKHKEKLFGLAAMERQLGIDSTGKYDGKTTPRDVEHEVTKKELLDRLEIAQSEFNEIPDGGIFIIKPRSGKDTRKMTKRDMVETIKEELYKPLFTKALNDIIRSNYQNLSEVLNQNLVKSNLDYEAFFGGGENIVQKIISGAQSGADVGGLEAARQLGIEFNGLAPKPKKGKSGIFRSELADGITDAQQSALVKKYNIQIDSNSSYQSRTKKNIRRSDATIAFRLQDSPGTDKTIGFAQTGAWKAGDTTPGIYNANPKIANSKPLLVLNNAKLNKENISLIRQFILKNPGTLNVAGHRESSNMGLQNQVRSLLFKSIKGLKQPHPWSDKSHPKHFEYKLSQLFLDSHGLVDINKIRIVHEYNMRTKELQTGERVIERQFHEDDLTFMHRQLDIYERVISFLKEKEIPGKEQFIVSKGNNFEIDWNALSKSKKLFKASKNDAKGLEESIRSMNQQYINQIATGMIGTREINGELFSNRYWSLMGQQDTKAGTRYVKEVHIPNEIKRINKLVTKDFQGEDRYLHQRLEDKLITLKDARMELITNMVQKLIKNPGADTEVYHEQVQEALSSLSTRQLGLDKPGAYKPTFTRRRPTIPVGNYVINDTVPLRYLSNLSSGVTQGIAALQTRVNLLSFRENTRFNKQIGKAEAEAWHLKMIDIVRGYMGYPTTRNIDLHGITKKDQSLLVKWAQTGFDNSFYQKARPNPVERKLMKDFIQQTTLRREEVASIEKEVKKKYDRALKERLKTLAKDIPVQIDKITDDEKKEARNYVLRTKQSFTNKMKKEIKERIEDAETDIRIEALKDENVDKTNIKNSFRSFYSDETVGNLGLKLDKTVNDLFGTDVNNKIPFLEKMPDIDKDPQGRHRAWVRRAHWFSDLEGKFEMMALLAHPKSAVANAYGGTTNTITDVGFKHFFESMKGEKLVNDHFRGIKYERFNAKTKQWEPHSIESKGDVYEYFELRGFVENNIRDELIMFKPPGDTQWRNFSNHVAKKIYNFNIRNSVHTADPNINKNNRLARKEFRELTLAEASKSFNINKKVVEAGSFFMKHSEYYLRMQSAIAHYLKAKELFTDTNGNTEVSEAFLLEYAKKGVSASQFIYHATNRPNFANTAVGRIMTRFHPYSWNSIRRRADVIREAQLVDGNKEFEAGKRFERQLSADLFASVMATTFAASIFEYALSPPMNWSMDFAQLMYGDSKERERAFYNTYGHPLLNPLQIISPPVSRFVVPIVVGSINGDFENFAKYTSWTWAPFGRVTRDLLRTAETPEMVGEWMFGVPLHKFGQYARRNEKISDENIESADEE